MNNPKQTGLEFYTTRAIAGILALLLIGVPVFLVARQHLGSPNLWFDESGQVFLSLGSYHYAAPYAPDGGWAKIVEYSRVFNGDPGGFTALLRFWIGSFGSSPAALRSLSFFFFLLMPVIVLLSARRVGVNPVIAALAASAPLGYPMLLHYATEVRPYSMEACAVAFLFFLPCLLPDEPRDWVVLATGCAAALLVTSHYSAFLYGVAACLVALLPIRPWRKGFRRASRFVLPLGIAATASFFLFARYSFGTLMTGRARIAPPFRPYVMSGNDTTTQLALLRENFFAYGALPITIFLLAAPLFVWLGPRSLVRLRTVVGRTFLFSALSVSLVALASLTGKMPWAWPTRWSIGYQALAACCVAMIVITAGTILWQMAETWRWKAVEVVAAVCIVTAWSIQVLEALHSEHPYYETIASQLQALADSPNAKSFRFFVQRNATPTTRYLVELGPLKGAFSYPKNFHFETPQEANDKTPISSRDYDIVVLTHSQFSDAYTARVTGGAAVESIATPAPSCLLVTNNIFGKSSVGKVTFFNTGTDTSGKLLTDGREDSHYRYAFTKRFTYRDPTDPGGFHATASLLATHYGWLGDDGDLSLSRWISVRGANPIAYAPPGYYQFRTTFAISGFNLSTFRLKGRWATDNDATGVYVNGHQLILQGFPLYREWTPLMIGPSKYFKRDNTLDFIVLNTLKQANPVGLRVELTGSDAGLPAATTPWVGGWVATVFGVVFALVIGTLAALPVSCGSAKC
jgi:hypothetical protein